MIKLLYDELCDTIINLVLAHAIQVKSVGMQNFWRYDEQHPSLTVLICVDHDDPSVWLDMARSVSRMFEARGFTSLQVEIRNPERLTTGSILSESADEKTVASYKSIEQDLLSIIVELGSICLAFGLIMSGNPDRKETFCPTIVVYVKDGSIYDWGRFLDACDRSPLHRG